MRAHLAGRSHAGDLFISYLSIVKWLLYGQLYHILEHAVDAGSCDRSHSQYVLERIFLHVLQTDI